MKYLRTITFSLTIALLSVACADANHAENERSIAPMAEPGHYFAVPVNAGQLIQTEEISVRLDEVVSGLGIIWGMAFLPDGSVLLTERQGSLRIVRNGQLQEEPITGLPDIYAVGQGGLLDVTIHPNFEENGWVYLSYSARTPEGLGYVEIMRARLDGNQLIDREILFQESPALSARHHFGNRIVFDNDGYMFFTIGDRGVMQKAQQLDNYGGKVFRLHDDGRIPSDNPFVGREDALDEIFTYGNRNPQGMILHPETGEIWTHEHGPRGGDELNVMRAGLNYGWPEITYGINYNGTIITEETEREGMEQPLHQWTPSIAPSGMVYVTSERYPAWQGNLLIGTLAPQYLHRAVLDGERVIHEEEMFKPIGRVRDVRQAPDGFIYFSTDNGSVFRILPE
ncbi:MAG: PQQ-dependent sugar dehydrogenase [Bacteroidetes bacterium]|nr:PQQ-dependent sugar dehydrogenase [Bacteroidota bacterium]MCH8524926.1 PQQ-dependent sugar dehydrogenase [Balneolales bacterium]